MNILIDTYQILTYLYCKYWHMSNKKIPFDYILLYNYSSTFYKTEVDKFFLASNF